MASGDDGAFGGAVVERGGEIVAFAGPAIVVAGAGADAAKVEAQHRDADAGPAAEHRAHDVAVHVAAELRARVSHRRRRGAVAAASASRPRG